MLLGCLWCYCDGVVGVFVVWFWGCVTGGVGVFVVFFVVV